MIKLRIKIKSENITFTKNEFLADNFVISKDNKILQEIVDKACKESQLQVIDDVIITARFEW